MNTVEQDIMIALLNSLLAKEIITQDIFDKSVQGVFGYQYLALHIPS